MESEQHQSQMILLLQTLRQRCAERGENDVAVYGNMAIYFSVEQARAQNFRAPDFFVVLGAEPRQKRKSWVMWQEGRAPNLVIELLSEKTKHADRGVKKQIYQDVLRVPEYVLFDVATGEFEAFRLARNGGRSALRYDPAPMDEKDGVKTFYSQELGLELTLWEGEFERCWGAWLRWRDPESGEFLPTPKELAALERRKAKVERERAEVERERAEVERERAERLAAKLRALGVNPDDVA
jgi:Uma2 family endonuclease